MSAPGAAGRRSAAVRLAGIGLLAAGVTAALYVARRLHTPDYTFGLFGRTGLGAIAFKSVLASVALGLAVPQVLLALWIYRKLPLAGGPPRPVRLAHRGIGFGLFALTVPIAVHCLLAYGVQLTSVRVAVHSLAGCFFYGAFAAKVLLVHSRRLPGWVLPAARGHARRCRRRALVHLRAVVLQRLLATRAIGTQISQVSPARVSRWADRARHLPAGLQPPGAQKRAARQGAAPPAHPGMTGIGTLAGATTRAGAAQRIGDGASPGQVAAGLGVGRSTLYREPRKHREGAVVERVVREG